MKVTISGRHMDVTDGIREHALARFQKLDKFSVKIDRVQLTIWVEGSRHTAEAVMHVGKGSTLIAEVDAPDMYAALELAATKLERQLKKHKERARNRRVAPKRG
ncbi:MAG: ribosome-associated translation inhibitor RaiA [Planctomycetes bacterium]|nr:ribosome-associated translation inhibitor RaiA [Planctomycetota bacterium]